MTSVRRYPCQKFRVGPEMIRLPQGAGPHSRIEETEEVSPTGTEVLSALSSGGIGIGLDGGASPARVVDRNGRSTPAQRQPIRRSMAIRDGQSEFEFRCPL